jgi:hypothetical protein
MLLELSFQSCSVGELRAIDGTSGYQVRRLLGGTDAALLSFWTKLRISRLVSRRFHAFAARPRSRTPAGSLLEIPELGGASITCSTSDQTWGQRGR